jgi:hypothetical protein
VNTCAYASNGDLAIWHRKCSSRDFRGGGCMAKMAQTTESERRLLSTMDTLEELLVSGEVSINSITVEFRQSAT